MIGFENIKKRLLKKADLDAAGKVPLSQLPDGIGGGVGLQYDWEGTQLGVKREDEQEYIYSDLKGAKGDPGDQGIQGPQGNPGADGQQGIQGPQGIPGTGLPLTYVNGTLTAGDVTMTNANTFYTGTQVVLGSGTWLIFGHITIGRAATTLQRYTGRISTGSVHYASSQMTQPSQNPHYVNIAMSCIITLAGETTILIQAAATSTSCLIKRACADNASGNNATQLNAVKISL